MNRKKHKTGVYRTEYDEVVSLPDGNSPVLLGSGVITGILGQGGSAVVYRIWNEQLGIYRAVKLLRPTASMDSRERFAREIKILAQLNHPNIINVHSVGEWKGLPYIEMDYVDGASLEQLIQEMGPFPLNVVLAMALFIARALDYTHSHKYKIRNVEYIGLLHRDLKPANVLLPKHDVLRLTDFGVASFNTVTITSTSQTGRVTGSMQYLAPEQLGDGIVDHRSDIYSFGCILYEMVTGEKAFPERHVAKLVKQRVQNNYVRLSKKTKKTPRVLTNLIESCMSLNPSGRPSSMKTILSYLETMYRRVEDRRPESIIRSFINGEAISSKSKISGIHQKISHGSRFFTTVQGFFFGAVSIAFLASLLVIFLHSPRSSQHDEDSFSMAEFRRQSGGGASAQPRENPILDSLMSRFDTRDTVAVISKLDSDGHYEELREVLQRLPLELRARTGMRVRNHRAIIALGGESYSYYSNNFISDGEYIYDKGTFLFEQGEYQRALWVLRDALTTPALLQNEQEFVINVRHQMSRASTKIAQRTGLERDYRTAYDQWDTLAQLMSERPYLPLYEEAQERKDNVLQELEELF
ncbi:serine/threonine-protein kinase [Chitinivibrio alkaliphilus]|uniref:Serine/threonine protein kinase n=1 Tax=Chitinivibrio alkaliphilus ACht1 TaxID=1313304 RepID=U7D953_9BACT|nr:serine/threonine-protein kinase [Chitinivibrio alkaliphilus]ERP38919.1 serine/threonine protein kinase [Chitinivibrio alkaliphilus ACht1]